MSFGCIATKLSYPASDLLRLDLNCDVDEDESKRRTEIMTFRKVDDSSFLMRMTNKEKFSPQGLQVHYCPSVHAGQWPSVFDIKRGEVQRELKAAE